MNRNRNRRLAFTMSDIVRRVKRDGKVMRQLDCGHEQEEPDNWHASRSRCTTCVACRAVLSPEPKEMKP